MIDRSADFATLLSLLTSASGDDTTIAVCGPGGFGKTTLATQACADPAVQQAFSEIVWVETGQDCTPGRLVELIGDVCVHLHGHRPALTTPEQAGFHLAQLTHDSSLLLVIDNVWSATDLAPFLLAPCTRLVTTRNVRTCPSSTQVLRLGPMTAPEISELLSRAVARLPRQHADQLSGLCGGWPLLATVVGSNIGADLDAGATPQRAFGHAHEALTVHGLQAFDVWDSDQRDNAIGHAITASLTSLEDVRITGGPGLRDRYLSLAVFPSATAVPVEVLSHWWSAAYDWSPPAVRQFCRVLADRSLISAYLADRDVVVLHDVFRSYLAHLLGEQRANTHRSLIDAYRNHDGWHRLGDEHRYLWQHLIYHLHEAGLDNELVLLLSAPGYVAAKASRVGSQALAADASILHSLGEFADTTHALHQPWSAAVTMTDTAYLLHGLTSQKDMTSTLAVALTRAGHRAPTQETDHPAAQPFPVAWTGRVDTEARLNGHTGAVVSVSTTGELLASGGEDGTVRVWNTAAPGVAHVLHAHTGWVYATALTSDGQMLASAGEDGQIRLWNPHSGKPIGVLPGHTRRIRALRFTRDNRLLLSAAEDGHIHVLDLRQRALTHTMATCGTPLWALAIDATGTLVAAAGEDQWVRLYDLTTGALLDEVAAHHDWVRTLAFAPTGSLLASGSGDRSVIVWEASTRQLRPVRTINDLPARVRAATWDHTGLLLVATEDAIIRTFDAAGPAGHIAMPAGVDWIRALACSRAGDVIAGCEDGAVRSWSKAIPDGLATIAQGADTIWSTDISTDPTTGALGHGDGRIELLDHGTGQLDGILDGGPGRIWSLASGEHIAAACGDGTIKVWSLTDHNLVLRANDDVNRTWAVAVNRAGDRLAASLGDGRIRCWGLPHGHLLWERPAHAGRVRSLTFDNEGKLLAICGGDGTVHLWDAVTGGQRRRFTNPEGWARQIAIDDTATLVAVGSGTGDIHIRDISTDRFTAHLPGHSGRVLMLSFLDDPDLLVSAAADGTVRAWSLRHSTQLAEIRLDAALNCATAHPATGQILAAGPAGPVLLNLNRTALGADPTRVHSDIS